MKKPWFAFALLGLFAAGAQAQSGVYKIDPTHTKAIFEAKHFGTSTNRGQWDKIDGEIQFDRAGKSGKAEIVIDMNSINTGVAPFNNHLKSADFFDVANYPTAKFSGNQFKFDGDKVSEVSGTLTMRGKTNPVTIKATGFNCFMHPSLKREVCGGDFEMVIKRSLFDVNYGVANRAIQDDVRVIIQVEAVRQ